MASRTFIRQDKQVRPSEAYDDTVPHGVALETDAENLQDDVNALRSQIRRILGEDNWYDAPVVSLADVADGGGSGSGFLYTNIVPSGDIDDANDTFIAPTYFESDLAGVMGPQVYVNGIRQQLSVHSSVAESGGPGSGYDTIIFAGDCIPEVGDIVTMDYVLAV